jgi:Fe-S-cluster containining protein
MRAGNIKDFPIPTDRNGVCSKYDKKTKQCTIYDERPLICRVDDYYKQKIHGNMTLKQWHQHNADVCNYMIYESGIDKKYLVEIKDDD